MCSLLFVGLFSGLFLPLRVSLPPVPVRLLADMSHVQAGNAVTPEIVAQLREQNAVLEVHAPCSCRSPDRARVVDTRPLRGGNRYPSSSWRAGTACRAPTNSMAFSGQWSNVQPSSRIVFIVGATPVVARDSIVWRAGGLPLQIPKCSTRFCRRASIVPVS